MPDNLPEPKLTDDIAGDLRVLLAEQDCSNNLLLENLLVYIKNRELLVGDHWFKVGMKRRNEKSA